MNQRLLEQYANNAKSFFCSRISKYKHKYRKTLFWWNADYMTKENKPTKASNEDEHIILKNAPCISVIAINVDFWSVQIDEWVDFYAKKNALLRRNLRGLVNVCHSYSKWPFLPFNLLKSAWQSLASSFLRGHKSFINSTCMAYGRKSDQFRNTLIILG